MHPRDFWWMAEFRWPKKNYLSMTEEEVEELYQQEYGDDEEENV